MKKQIFYTLISSIIFLLYFTSCEYKDNGTYFVEVDQNIQTPNFSSSLDFDADTVYFHTSSNYWSINSDSSDIYLVQFYIDGSLYTESETPSGYLNFDYTFFQDFSYHILTCVTFYESGTGSLADAVGAEARFVQKDWVAVFIPEDASPAKITKFYKDSLDYVCEYSPYEYNDFESYILMKNGRDTVAITYNQNDLILRDTTYSGEEAEYELITEVKSGNWLNRSYKKVLQDYPPYEITYLNNNSYRITIPKNKYATRLAAVRFLEQVSYNNEFNILKQAPSNESVSFTIENIDFKPEIFYKLLFYPKYNNKALELHYNIQNYSVNIRALGSEFIDHYFIGGGDNNNVYVGASGGYVICYNTNTRTMDTIGANPGYTSFFAISASGKYAAISTGVGKFNIIKTIDNSVIETIDAGELQPQIAKTRFAISDNGLIVYASNSTIEIYDFINKNKLQSLSLPNNNNDLYMSSDGKAFATDNNLYKFKDGLFNLEYTTTSKIIGFNPKNPVEFYSRNADKIDLFNFNNGVVFINVIDVSDKICNLDIKSNSVIYFKDNQIIFKSLSGNIWNTLGSVNDSYYYNYHFYNNALFFQDNFYYVLNFEN